MRVSRSRSRANGAPAVASPHPLNQAAVAFRRHRRARPRRRGSHRKRFVKVFLPRFLIWMQSTPGEGPSPSRKEGYTTVPWRTVAPGGTVAAVIVCSVSRHPWRDGDAPSQTQVQCTQPPTQSILPYTSRIVSAHTPCRKYFRNTCHLAATAVVAYLIQRVSQNYLLFPSALPSTRSTFNSYPVPCGAFQPCG